MLPQADYLTDKTEYTHVKELLSDEEKLEDYLDYLHMQNVKVKSKRRFSFEEVKKELFNS